MGRGRGEKARGRGHRGHQSTNLTHSIRREGTLEKDDTTMNSNLPERFRGANRQSSIGTASSDCFSDYDVKVNLDIRHYVQQQDKITQSPEDWRGIPEIPTSAEISLLSDEQVALPANKIKGKWKSSQKYLKAHYELLREDAVSPLRDAIDIFRKNPEMMDDHSVQIYEKVHIDGFTFANLGIAARIKFSTARAGRKINWQSSKRLVSGSIVALTPAKDRFQNKCVIAIVAARPQAGLECMPPEIDVYFGRADDIEIDPQVEWLMIESKQGYYESTRYTMRAIQKLSTESFPLSEHICSLSNELLPPEYLTKRPIIDISAAVPDVAKNGYLQQVDILTQWPSAPEEHLDQTQWDAMHQILTKRLAIIQGPPGTGKTHTSKLALQILIENRSKDDPPIIVAAQTNHALDQLLSHVAKFDQEYIRLGGRSTNPEVKKRALFEIRQKVRIPNLPGGLLGQAIKRKESETHALREILEPLAHRDTQKPWSAEQLFDLGVITKQQAESLVKGAKEWVSTTADASNETQIWLGKALTIFELNYQPDNFGFEEADEDLEVEQLREHEAETGVADEEDIECLRGHWTSVFDRWTVQQPSDNILGRAKQQLDTSTDLWKVTQSLRGPMYLIMQEKAKRVMTVRFREQAKAYERLVQELKVGRWERDAVYLSRANIIGLTTTGLSKYRPLIASLKAKIILIEEAAEVIEAPISVACIESLEHLILVGDHKQLQGHCSVRELEGEPYNLNVSMFERLVNNGIPYQTLLRQRRMDPELRQLLGSIYPELQDHPHVTDRGPLSPFGMGKRKSFFMDHDWPELRDDQMSTFNDKEALFIAGFYEYLLLNKVNPSNITVLTFYNGQRKRILKYIRDRPRCQSVYHNVKTVDSYQGEENDIVILSLVRSNDVGKIGFLENENRVCVALSRAKFGFYIFGNGNLLSGASELWKEVVETMDQSIPKRSGCEFSIQCNKHGRITTIKYPEDWNSHQGGCKLACGEFLPCGHACELKCHPYDHEELECYQPCQKTLLCGHVCQHQCHESCFCNCAAFRNANPWDKDPGGDGTGDAAGSHGKSHDIRNQASSTSSGQAITRPGAASNQPSHSTYPSRKGSERRKNLHQVLTHLPNMQASLHTKETNTNTLSSSPEDISAPFTPVSSSQTSASSGATPRKYRGSFYRYGLVMGSQHSPDKQDHGRARWEGFAEGGAKKDDDLRKTAKLQEPTEPEPNLIDFFDEPTKPVTAKKVKDLKSGRKIFTETYQPVSSQPPMFGHPTSIQPRMVSAGKPTEHYFEESLLD